MKWTLQTVVSFSVARSELALSTGKDVLRLPVVCFIDSRFNNVLI